MEEQTAPEIVLDPENPQKTLTELKEAAAQLTPEQIEANRKRLMATARRDRRPIPTQVRRLEGVTYGLHTEVFVLVVQTPYHIRVELHNATVDELGYFKALFLPTNPNAKIELRRRRNHDATPAVRRWLREEAKRRGEFPTS